MQLDLFNEYKLEESNKKIQKYERIIKEIIFNCNHYQNTKCNYTQQEIGEYLIWLIEWELRNDYFSRYIYFIIPTINGEIFGNPYIFIDEDQIKYIKEEVTIYKIDCITLECMEVSQ